MWTSKNLNSNHFLIGHFFIPFNLRVALFMRNNPGDSALKFQLAAMCRYRRYCASRWGSYFMVTLYIAPALSASNWSKARLVPPLGWTNGYAQAKVNLCASTSSFSSSQYQLLSNQHLHLWRHWKKILLPKIPKSFHLQIAHHFKFVIFSSFSKRNRFHLLHFHYFTRYSIFKRVSFHIFPFLFFYFTLFHFSIFPFFISQFFPFLFFSFQFFLFFSFYFLPFFYFLEFVFVSIFLILSIFFLQFHCQIGIWSWGLKSDGWDWKKKL